MLRKRIRKISVGVVSAIILITIMVLGLMGIKQWGVPDFFAGMWFWLVLDAFSDVFIWIMNKFGEKKAKVANV